MDTMIDAVVRPEDTRNRTAHSGVDEVAVGTGASIVVVVAATIALVLALLVASLGHAAAASSEAAPPRMAAPIATGLSGASTPIALALLGVSAPPARDGLYRLALPAPKADKSLAVAVVGGLFLAMTGAAGMAWRAVIGSALGGARRPVPARRRPPARGPRPLPRSLDDPIRGGEPRYP